MDLIHEMWSDQICAQIASKAKFTIVLALKQIQDMLTNTNAATPAIVKPSSGVMKTRWLCLGASGSTLVCKVKKVHAVSCTTWCLPVPGVLNAAEPLVVEPVHDRRQTPVKLVQHGRKMC